MNSILIIRGRIRTQRKNIMMMKATLGMPSFYSKLSEIGRRQNRYTFIP